MSANTKEIHIVFQVLNFLHGDHYSVTLLTPNEKLLLIALASHKGIKGICPSISLLAKELKITIRSVERQLRKMEALELIQIQENIGKPHDYFLYIPLPTPVTHDRGGKYTTPDASVRVPPTPVSLTPDASVAIYNKEELSNNKKLLYAKSENEKKHPFADSMNRMSCEQKHIRQHEEIKAIEMQSKRTGVPQNIKDMLRSKSK